MEVILYSKECNWYTRYCPLNGGVRYRECPLREAILYICDIMYIHVHVYPPSLISFFQLLVQVIKYIIK